MRVSVFQQGRWCSLPPWVLEDRMMTATVDPLQSAWRPWGGQSPQRGDTTARRLVEVLATAAGEDTTVSVTGALVDPVVRARGRHVNYA